MQQCALCTNVQYVQVWSECQSAVCSSVHYRVNSCTLQYVPVFSVYQCSVCSSVKCVAVFSPLDLQTYHRQAPPSPYMSCSIKPSYRTALVLPHPPLYLFYHTLPLHNGFTWWWFAEAQQKALYIWFNPSFYWIYKILNKKSYIIIPPLISTQIVIKDLSNLQKLLIQSETVSTH